MDTKKKYKKSEAEIMALVDPHVSRAVAWVDTRLTSEQSRIQRYYDGDLPRRQHEGSSSYVSSDVYDGVESMKSQLLEVFAGGHDIVRFKALNDAQGHEAGDRLLRAVAHAWLDALRGTDLLARIGGDEFAVLLPGCSAADHGAVAARLRAACPHDAGCGLGLALWDGREDRDALLRRADRAMYADKTSAGTVQSGRGSATVRPT